MNINTVPHIPVLHEEVSEAFSDIDHATIVDCTLGYGGHTEALLKAHPAINIVGIDQDMTAIDFSKQRLAPFGDRVTFLHGRFSDMIKKLDRSDIRGVLADIGVSSLQLDEKDRGFGFHSGQLDMRMDKTRTLRAYDVVNHYEQRELERIFREYGEVREYKKAADLIVKARLKKPFESAAELAEFLAKHLHAKKIHPATLVFQAIRIEVNDELGELERLLQGIYDLQLSNATIGIISFHSLEDRIVKRHFKGNERLMPLTKRPLRPSDEEVFLNHRARSARLRAAERV